MKKTLIAAAVAAVAAAPAMADVSISGQVQVKLTDTENATGDWAPAYDNSLNFKATEDLGNGMTAFAQLSIDVDDLNHTHTDTDSLSASTVVVSDQTGGGTSTVLTSATTVTDGTTSTTNMAKDMKVGLKGSFGTVVLGSMEYLHEGAFSSKMDIAGLEQTEIFDIDGRPDAIAYVSPTVNGLHVAVAGNMDGAQTGVVHNKEILVGYTNGPLNVMVSRTDVKDSQEMTGLYASYNVGDLTVAAMRGEVDYDAATSTDIDSTSIRLDYKMGNNTITVGSKDSDQANTDVDGIRITHSMSKRTSFFVDHQNKEGTAADTTTLSIKHTF